MNPRRPARREFSAPFWRLVFGTPFGGRGDFQPKDRPLDDSAGVNKGYIKLSRKLAKSPMWLGEPFCRALAWIDLIMLANFKDGYVRIRGVRIDLKRGQLAASSVFLADRWKWSRTKVASFLNELEKEQQIGQQKTNVTNVVTILNYDRYQDANSKLDSKLDSRSTAEVQQTGQQKDTQKKGISKSNNEEGREERPLPPLERLIAGWNKIEGLAKTPLHPSAPWLVEAYTTAWGVEALRAYLKDPGAILAELRQATFMHGKPNLTLAWLLGQKEGKEPNLLRLMAGAYRENGNGEPDEPEPPPRIVNAEVERQRVIEMRKRTGKIF